MRVTISKSKNAEQVYITKGFRDSNGKSTSRIVKKLGSMKSLLPKFDNNYDNVIAWAKQQATIMTQQEKAGFSEINIAFSEMKLNEKGIKLNYNIGYLFTEMICNQLKIDDICNSIKKKTNIQYDLAPILKMLIETRIIAPSSKLSSYDYAFNFLKQPKYELQNVYRALDVLSKYSDTIQNVVYENSHNIINRNKEVLYYDCTNYFFEIEEERGNAQYGKSKENRPNPIIQMGMFLDGDGFPLSFTMFPGKNSEQPTLKPLEIKILKDFNISEFIVCTDAGLSSYDNRKFNAIQGRSYVVTQSLKKLKSHLKEWALDENHWKLLNSKKEYNIKEINEETFYNKIFYKERWINENGLEQRLIVTYSPKDKEYQQNIREQQISRALKIVENGKSYETRNQNSPKRFISEIAITENGEIADNKQMFLDEKIIANEKMYDGFYAVCTTLEKDVTEIIKINKQRWQIEAAFRTMKTEFKARPVYLRNDNRIEAHFLTCFLALLVLKIIEKKLNNKYSSEEIIKTLRKMNLHKLKGLGYLSSYEPSDLTDSLHEAFGFRTDNEFISETNLKKILKKIKNI